MDHIDAAGFSSRTRAVHDLLRAVGGNALAADLRFLEAWESNRSMHLGIILRIQQIRRANPLLCIEIAAELATRRNASGSRSAPQQDFSSDLEVV